MMEIKLTDSNAREISERFIESIASYPGGYSGRGIVICGGGVRYFTNAWVAINMLRRHGCHLPIQIWYLGAKEMDDQMRDLVRSFSVDCIDAREVRKMHPARILNGWEAKPYAIIHSPFKEVLLLDADNVPVVNPEFLFETSEYKRTGAIFWPDFGRLGPKRSIWKVAGIEYRDESEFESGQIVIDKERCWKAMALCMWYNEHSDFFYHHIHGDKETFHLAFRKLDQPYSMPEKPIVALQDTMCQHDFEGKRIFQHRNLDKWSLFHRNKRIAGFLYEEECQEYLSVLRNKWNGIIDHELRYSTEIADEELRKVAAELTSSVHLYRRVGYDQRGIVFLENGSIGTGSAGCEVLWTLKRQANGVQLVISSDKDPTCILEKGSDNVWRGPWLKFEKMPVEIFSAATCLAQESFYGRHHIVVRSPLNAYTGYGQQACQLISELADLGHHVQVRSNEVQEAFAQVDSLIKKRLTKGKTDNEWELLFFPPTHKPEKGKKTAFMTMWETTRLPKNGVENLNQAACVIVPSVWNAACFSACGVTAPIHVVPLGINNSIFSYTPMEMDGPCVFGTAGRTDGGGIRKGFSKVITAFQKAFPAETDVRLDVKVFPDCRVEGIDDLRIRIIRQYFGEKELVSWFRSLTCFVSGSRGEGWGLMHHQALATGRPIISIKYSGVTEFFNEEIGYPISFSLKPAGGVYANCGHWADPSEDDMVAQMRRVYANREEAQEKGAKAAQAVTRFSKEHARDELQKVMREVGMLNIISKRPIAKNNKVITMALYNRPGYTKTVLEAMAKCDGIGDYLIIPHVEPGNEEVLNLARGINFAECQVYLNKHKLGCGLNTFFAWQDGFKASDFIIHIEDDTVPARDCLRYMEHCNEAYFADKELFSISSYNRQSCSPEDFYRLGRRSAYTCWLLGTWRDRWDWAKNNWSRESARYATHLSKRILGRNLKEIYPLLSRSQNIGAEGGVHVPSAAWHHQNQHTEHWAGNYNLEPGRYAERGRASHAPEAKAGKLAPV